MEGWMGVSWRCLKGASGWDAGRMVAVGMAGVSSAGGVRMGPLILPLYIYRTYAVDAFCAITDVKIAPIWQVLQGKRI